MQYYCLEDGRLLWWCMYRYARNFFTIFFLDPEHAKWGHPSKIPKNQAEANG